MTPANVAAARYREHAANCIRFAEELIDPGSKLTLLDMGRAWLALADQAEKNDGLLLLFETPEPRQHE